MGSRGVPLKMDGMSWYAFRVGAVYTVSEC